MLLSIKFLKQQVFTTPGGDTWQVGKLNGDNMGKYR
jgi:hypothetical protein